MDEGTQLLDLLRDCAWASKGVGRSPGVERPYIEAARIAEKFFIVTYLLFTYEETTLVASRYFEGHALTLYIYAVTV